MVAFDLFRLESEESKKKGTNLLFITSARASERPPSITFCSRSRIYRLTATSPGVLIKSCFNKTRYTHGKAWASYHCRLYQNISSNSGQRIHPAASLSRGLDPPHAQVPSTRHFEYHKHIEWFCRVDRYADENDQEKTARKQTRGEVMLPRRENIMCRQVV